jgi:transposase
MNRSAFMVSPLINIPLGSIHLYQTPISMRFGEKKLIEICHSALNREPRVNELFLFYNRTRDTLKLFWLDGTGSQEVSKSVPRGGFLLPAPKDGETFVKLERSKLSALFRS